MADKIKFKPGDGPFRFKTKLEGMDGMEAAAFHPPFAVPEIFGTKARVPVRGTINGFPFRSSLCNMGDGHMMVVNKTLRAGAKCKAGDMVDVILQRDRDDRVVEVPEYLNKRLLPIRGQRQLGIRFHSRTKRNGCTPSKRPRKKKHVRRGSTRC